MMNVIGIILLLTVFLIRVLGMFFRNSGEGLGKQA